MLIYGRRKRRWALRSLEEEKDECFPYFIQHRAVRAALRSSVIWLFITPPAGEKKAGRRRRRRSGERSSRDADSRWNTGSLSRACVVQPGVIEWSHSGLSVRYQAAAYEDWYTSARLRLLDHQTDWYYTLVEDEDKVSVIILNTAACQRREIIQCHWLWERFTDCRQNLSDGRGAPWQSAEARLSCKDLS